jgi:hypothetical protein
MITWAALLASVLALGLSGSSAGGWKQFGKISVAILTASYIAFIALRLFKNQGTVQTTANEDFASSLGFANEIVFQTSRGVVRITSRAEITAFAQIVEEGQIVEAHHSYPVNRVRIWFNDHRHTYRLGEDAYVKDEYWLEEEAGDNLNNWRVKQFQSQEMRAWLTRHLPDYDHAGLALPP